MEKFYCKKCSKCGDVIEITDLNDSCLKCNYVCKYCNKIIENKNEIIFEIDETLKHELQSDNENIKLDLVFEPDQNIVCQQCKDYIKE